MSIYVTGKSTDVEPGGGVLNLSEMRSKTSTDSFTAGRLPKSLFAYNGARTPRQGS